MLEVAKEISNTSRFIVGSSQVEDFLGLPYRDLLYILNTGRFRGTQAWNKIFTEAAPKSWWRREKYDEPFMLAQVIPKVMKRGFDPRYGIHGAVSPTAIDTVTLSSIST